MMSRRTAKRMIMMADMKRKRLRCALSSVEGKNRDVYIGIYMVSFGHN